MIPLLMTALVLDADGGGTGLLGMTSTTSGTSVLLTGSWELGPGVTPVLIWPKGGALWSNPCLTQQCCLRNVSITHRNDALTGTCSLDPAIDYVQGSRPNVLNTPAGFTATLDPPFPAWVAVLFVGPQTSAVRTLSVANADSIAFDLKVHNPICNQVNVPGTPLEVCMYCDNQRPFNSDFTWTPNWFSEFQCSWQCRTGYSETGPSCLPTVNIQIQSLLPWGLAGLVLICLACMLTRQVEEPDPPHMPPPPSMVQFNRPVSHTQIRVKIN